MKFCTQCENMYYIQISETNPNELQYYCRNCGTKENVNEHQKISISTNDSSEIYKTTINEYTKLDPSLPRITNILCPNTDCETNTKNTPREIIYIRFDNKNMKYLYMCSTCDHVWKPIN